MMIAMVVMVVVMVRRHRDQRDTRRRGERLRGQETPNPGGVVQRGAKPKYHTI